MIISSYNVNGIRAAGRKGFGDWMTKTDPDIVCLQELKAHEEQIPGAICNGSYHGVYHCAEKKGYSGVALLSKEKPLHVECGMGVDWVDSEGRVIMAEFKNVRVFSIYAPSGTTGSVRQAQKYRFMDDFLLFAAPYARDKKPTVFCGDFNIAHREIDIHNPVSNKKSSGFLPEEREWFTRLLESGYADVFRMLNADLPDLYSWWTYRARAKSRNKGWRIDYHLATASLMENAGSAKIESEWDMSDHAPVTVNYTI
ncbi:MAG: exodeoxyribonuclease III [Balneolales bacterium]